MIPKVNRGKDSYGLVRYLVLESEEHKDARLVAACPEVEALLELRRLLANATANLNQLARHANTSGELPTAGLIDRVLADVSETTARVRRTVEERR